MHKKGIYELQIISPPTILALFSPHKPSDIFLVFHSDSVS